MPSILRHDKNWASLVKRAQMMLKGGYHKTLIEKRLHSEWRTLQRKAAELGLTLE